MVEPPGFGYHAYTLDHQMRNTRQRRFTLSRSGNLVRSRNRWLAGVCGGLANWLGWSPTMVRNLYILVPAISAAFPRILVHLILWLVMPSE